MWEWRIFFREEQKDLILSYDNIVSLVQSSQIETRSDFYYLINDYSIGLKDRGPVISKSFKPKFELKLLTKRSSFGCEYWIKPIREQLNKSFDITTGLDFKTINEIFTKYREDENQLINTKLDFILQEFDNSNVKRLETKKKRKQAIKSVMLNNQKYDLTFEHTKLEIQNEKWETIAVEDLSIEAVELFVKQYSYEKHPPIMGYPQFLSVEILK